MPSGRHFVFCRHYARRSDAFGIKQTGRESWRQQSSEGTRHDMTEPLPQRTDRARFEALAMIHLDAAYSLAFALLRTQVDAQDAVQDAYLRAYRALHQLQGTEIKPWLLTIVRNVCYRHLQERRGAGNVISLDEALGPRSAVASDPAFAYSQPSPEQAAISASEQALLAEAIGALAPAFREVIVLRELEELSYREIADIIGAPVGTVMSRLSRARTELRAQMTRLMDRDDSHAV
jgi:RNA polymerase sigma-70 factor, ECF subfamily